LAARADRIWSPPASTIIDSVDQLERHFVPLLKGG